jgi:hypothetical protein
MKHVQKKSNLHCGCLQANFLVSLGSIHKASRSVLYGGTCAFSENETDKETALYTKSIAILPPFSPIEGHKWFDQILANERTGFH